MVGRPLSWGGDGVAKPCRGLANIPGKGLAGALRAASARVLPGPLGIFGRSLAGASWASSAWSLAVVLSSGSYLGLAGPLSSQRSACHHGGASRALVPVCLMAWELLDSRVAAPLVLGKFPWQGSCRGREGRPGKDHAGGVSPRPSALHASGLEHGSGSLVSLLPLLSRQARLRVYGCDCPRTSKWVQKGRLLSYTDTNF